MKILVLNSGSSSFKFQLFNMPEGEVIASGIVENIGTRQSILHLKVKETAIDLQEDYPNHGAALRKVSALLLEERLALLTHPDELSAIGHRVVHGGEKFYQPTRITAEVKHQIKALFSLAPLHNPPNLTGIEVAEEVFHEVPQVAVFDTAFHHTIPEPAFRIPVPDDWYNQYGVRNYGFHGTSHKYITDQALQAFPVKDSRIITVHLGNGCSMAAVRNGKCIDVSMGLGPLSGLMMGTRPGDLDPSVIFHMIENGWTAEEVKNALNKQSGMKGIAGDHDLRNVHQMAAEGNKKAQLALDMYAYRIKKYIGSYMAALGGLDMLIFTAGVGENDAWMRKKSLEGLEVYGLELDEKRNAERIKGLTAIHKGKVRILVVPTNEELEIARQTYALMKKN